MIFSKTDTCLSYRLSKLPGREYGEVSISAAQLLLSCKTPPFETRLTELRAALGPKNDLSALSSSSTLTAGVDLLTTLFDDKDPNIAKAAIEVYIRRVYRAHKITSLKVQAFCLSSRFILF